MKYIKIYEKYHKYKFKIDEYVKIDNSWSMHIDKIGIIRNRWHKAQGWLDDTNEYEIEMIYKYIPTGNVTKISKIFTGLVQQNERYLEKLTDKEIKDIEFFETTNKFNL